MDGNRWTDVVLEPMRAVGDPPADRAIQDVVSVGGDQALRAVLTSLVRNDTVVPADLPPTVRDYFAQTEGLPSWADPAQIVKGEEIFRRYGPEITAILLCASLPFCYACAKGVNVLALSAQLSQFVERRILETARFLYDVMLPGGLHQGGIGVRATQKIRLLHATMRHVMLAQPHWNPAWGFPLNQEDMALTLMTFSWVVLDSLQHLAVLLDPAEQAAYFHAWNVVGTMLGLHPDLLPTDMEDGHALFVAIGRRQYGPSEAGTAVTKALIAFLQHIIPGSLFDGFVVTNIRYLVGEAVSDMLEVPQPNWTQALLPPLKLLRGFTGRLEHQSESIHKLTGPFSRALLHGLEWVNRGGDRPMFHVPDMFRAPWGLPS